MGRRMIYDAVFKRHYDGRYGELHVQRSITRWQPDTNAIRADDKQRLLQHFQNLAHSPSTIASLVSSDHTKR